MARARRKGNSPTSGEAGEAAQEVCSGPGEVARGYREARAKGKLHVYRKSFASHGHAACHRSRFRCARQRESGVRRNLRAVQETPVPVAQGLRVETKAPARPNPGLTLALLITRLTTEGKICKTKAWQFHLERLHAWLKHGLELLLLVALAP